MPQPNKIPRPFADSGDKNSIPDSSGALGFASWQEGFPAITGTPFAQGGVAPKRADFNGIFNALSLAALWQQQGGFYAYDATTDYEVGNVVEYSGDLYKCITANGPSSAVKAPTDTTVWNKVMTASDVAALYLPLSGGEITGDMLYKSQVTRGTAPGATFERYLFDNIDMSGNRLAVCESVYYTDKSSRVGFYAYNTSVASGGFIGRLVIGSDPSGNVYTEAPTPATSDNSTKIATTAFVENFASNKVVGTLTPTSRVGANYSTLSKQNHVGYIYFSFALASGFSPANWTVYDMFTSSIKPTEATSGFVNTQTGDQGGLFVTIDTNGVVKFNYTGGSLPTNTYYHGCLVFPC